MESMDKYLFLSKFMMTWITKSKFVCVNSMSLYGMFGYKSTHFDNPLGKLDS